MKRVIVIGAGGHAKVVLEILQRNSAYDLAGLLDSNKEMWGQRLLGVSVLGGDALLKDLFDQGIRYAFIGIGTTGSTKLRRDLFDFAIQTGFQFISAIHPQSIVSAGAQVGAGVAIMGGAIVNVGARIGDNVIINTGAVVEHDCRVGHHAHIATGALLAGGVIVGDETHVGIGATVRQGIRVGRNVVVGAGAVVVNDVDDNLVIAGNPARILKSTAA